MGQISGAFGWRELVEELADASPCGLDGSLIRLSEQGFELGEDLLDRIEVRTVWGQEQEMGAHGADSSAGGLSFVASQIVEDDDVAGLERRNQVLLDPGRESAAIDRSIEHQRCDDPIAAQTRQKGQRLPVAERHLAHQGLTARRPAGQPGHVGLDPGLIDEHQPTGVKAVLMRLPAASQPGYPRPILLGRHQRFF